jgi:Holliday junction DNA helicase RuvA
MIASLTGTIASLLGQRVVIDVQGVGYEVWCTGGCTAKLKEGARASLVIYTDVKEDSIRLYGFEDATERQVFLLLTQVKGVGTKTSVEIISRIDKLGLLKAIAKEDLTTLQSVRGVGKKMAERIIVELKDKVKEFALVGYRTDTLNHKEGDADPFSEAMEALLALGFSRKVAERALEQAKSAGLKDSGRIVKEALRFV